MARRPRIEFAGAFYHVICRGNQRQRIFRDDQDRKKYLELLAKLKHAYRFHVHAYVLMENHVHLLLEAGDIPLSRVMQRLNSGYTQYFNWRHKLVGHLFQGRYKAILCDKDSYLVELSRYLHLNPVRAKMVKDPGDYLWSSYRCYLSGGSKQPWLETSGVLRQFSPTLGEAKKLYRKFVLEGMDEGHKEEYYDLLDGRFLGDRQFAQEVKSQAGDEEKVRLKIEPEALLKTACKVLGKRSTDVVGAGKDRERVGARELVCYVGRSCTELSVKAIAKVLGVDATCVSRSVARIEERLKVDRRLEGTLKQIISVAESTQNSKYHV
jgi:REP element-mobilizing transposase RayT